MGIKRLQAWPETDSWWELITVLERARLVWTNLAAKFTECTWSLGAIFLTLWESIDLQDRMASKNCWDAGKILERVQNLISPYITTVARRRSAHTTFSRRGLRWVLFQNCMMHLNQYIKMGVWPVSRSAQWVSGSTFLDTQESFQEAKMKDMCRIDFWGIICQRISGPYLTTVQTSC